MKSMHLLLREAEEKWRREVHEDYPLRGDTPVIKEEKQSYGRDWHFSTDLTDIYAIIGNDEELQRKFETTVKKYWGGEPEEVARETLHYLLYHELFHPIEAPFSVSGKDNDNKKIHQAIRRGILKVEPKLSPLEQLVKVQATENAVKDFILDNRFAVENKETGNVRQDVIPVWDLLELEGKPSTTNFYTVTRLLYGMLYGPQSTHEFFEEKAGSKGHYIAEKALSKLLGKTVRLPEKESIATKAKRLLRIKDPEADLQQHVQDIRTVFSGEDRYKGIERFMEVLGPYVQKGMPKGRADMHGEGTGVSPQNILQDLLDDMPSEEQQEFLEQLSQESPENLEQATTKRPSTPKDSSESEQMKNLDVLAAHEYYKRNHPRIKITGGNKVGESEVVGQREYWRLKNSQVLTEDQLSRVNLGRVSQLQRKSRLPWLIDLGNRTYRLDEYELETKDVKDVKYVDPKIDVPDVTEFYLDSSGSMGTPEFKVNDGSSWDMLSYVLYGFVDALHQGARQVGKQSRLRIHNFANRQVDSGIITVEEFLDGQPEALRTLFKPNNGYDQEDINITHYKDGQKRAYVVVTDGNLVIAGRTEREYAKMRTIAKDPNNNVVLFEIGGTYDLGNAVKGDSNIKYHPVHDKQQMLQAGLEVLLAK